MGYEIHPITERLRAAREAKGISQRDLSALAGVPQPQISRIEAGAVNLRVSTLVALANALDLEVTLVPRQALPAVRSIVRQAIRKPEPPIPHGDPHRLSDVEPRPAYSLDDDD